MASNFQITFKGIKKVFIDQERLRRGYYSRAQKGLSRIGAYVRSIARRSIKQKASAKSRQLARLGKARSEGDRNRVARVLAALGKAGSSQPGKPPFAHSPDHQSLSMRAIYFAAFQDRVIIGPVRTDGGFAGSSARTLPELLEFGGSATIREESADGQTWSLVRGGSSRMAGKKIRQRKVTYRARPFMNPALVKASPQVTRILASVWK